MAVTALQAAEDDRAPELYDLLAVLTVTSVVAVVVRFWSRGLKINDGLPNTRASKLWWDDLLVLLIWFASIAMNGLGYDMLRQGLGRHLSTLGLFDVVPFLRDSFAINILFRLGIALTQSAAIFFYHRIFDIKGSLYSRVLRAVHISIWVYMPLSLGLVIFGCNPVDLRWNLSRHGSCMALEASWTGLTVLGVVLDVIVLVLPLPKLWRLQTSVRKKLLVSMIFFFGYASCIVTIMQMVYLLIDDVTYDLDYTWNRVSYLACTFCALPMALVSLCIPNVVHLVNHSREHGMVALLRLQTPHKIEWLQRADYVQPKDEDMSTSTLPRESC